MTKNIYFDLEIEKALLFSLLTFDNFNNVKNILQKISFLTEYDFYDKRHAILYTTIKEIVEDGLLPDLVMLYRYAEKKGKKEIDINYIASLISRTDIIPITLNIKEYAKELKKKSLLRERSKKEAEFLKALEKMDEEDLVKTSEIAKEIAKYSEEILSLERADDIVKFSKNNIKQLHTVCYDLLPVGYISILAGNSGIGKTYTAISLACSFILETNKKVLLWLSEDLGQIDYRINQVLENTNFKQYRDKIENNLFYVNKVAKPLLTTEFGKTIIDKKTKYLFETYFSEFDFVILDPLLSFFGANENNNTDARLFINTLTELILDTDKVILLLHHVNKTRIDSNSHKKNNNLESLEMLKNKIRGASAFLDSVRTVLYLRINKDSNKRELVVVKSNVGKLGHSVVIEMPFKKENRPKIKL